MLVQEKTLRKIVKESIRDVLKEERFHLYEILVPRVAKKELREIETAYGSPSRYHKSEFKDMTDWVMK